MSALIRQSHANNTDPLWASAQGGENIVTDEITINQGGSITLGSSLVNGTVIQFNKALDGSTFAQLQTAYRGNGTTDIDLSLFNTGGYDTLATGNLNMYGQDVAYGTTDYLNFEGTGGSFGLSHGTNTVRDVYLDKLETGTAIITSKCVGPEPALISTAGPYAINPIPTAPAPFDYFGFGTAYPTTLGEEYDVYAMGTFGLVSGTGSPTIPDTMVVTFEVGGGGTGTGVFYFNPELPNWSVRARLVCNSSSPTIRVGCQNSQASGSTAVWSASCTLCDIVRVR